MNAFCLCSVPRALVSRRWSTQFACIPLLFACSNTVGDAQRACGSPLVLSFRVKLDLILPYGMRASTRSLLIPWPEAASQFVEGKTFLRVRHLAEKKTGTDILWSFVDSARAQLGNRVSKSSHYSLRTRETFSQRSFLRLGRILRMNRAALSHSLQRRPYNR